MAKEILPKYKSDKTHVRCLCDCGNEKIISRSNLVSGHTLSCGCTQKISKHRKDLIGKRFGSLIVTKMLYNYNGKNNTCCECKCDCGNTTVVYACNLKKGTTRSCGCFEKASRFGRNHTEDLTGMIFSSLKVLHLTNKKESNGSSVWECECVCGNIISVSSGDLKRGRAVSCGCNYVHPLKKNLTGKRFGKLTVVSEDKTKKRVAWKCLCDCGRSTIVTSDCLLSGNTTSCGCKINSINVDYIISILKENDIHFELEKRFDDCKNKRPLPFDFFLPDYNTCIEYDGEQHFKPIEFWGGDVAFAYRQQNDTIKNNYCKENNINLIRLPYTLSVEDIKNIILDIKNP